MVSKRRIQQLEQGFSPPLHERSAVERGSGGEVSFLRSIVIGVILLAAACSPGTPPEVLEKTPGPPVTITDDQVITILFGLKYPAGWRVITGESTAPPTVTLVAPGDCEIILASTARDAALPEVATCADEPVRLIRESVMVDGGVLVTLVGQGRESVFDTFTSAYNTVKDSLEAVRG